MIKTNPLNINEIRGIVISKFGSVRVAAEHFNIDYSTFSKIINGYRGIKNSEYVIKKIMEFKNE